jgi:hypothetical protein
MFIFLRIIRAIFGVVFASELLNLALAISTYFTDFDSATLELGNFFGFVVIKLALIIASCIIFFYLRKLINKLHEDKHGKAHPALAEKKWNL